MPYDRRTPVNGISVCRRIRLTAAQLRTLRASQELGWRLAFVRQALGEPVPVLFATKSDYLVLRADGSVDCQPDIAIRH